MPNETLTCHQCHETLTSELSHAIQGDNLCYPCYERETEYCSSCGERVYRSDFYPGTEICSTCYEEDYITCDHCGEVTHYGDSYSQDDGSRYCYECHQDTIEAVIHNYSYKPESIFYGNDSRYFGVELEIDRGGYLEENAKFIQETANALDDHIYIKHDGSLDDGFELVTHPMTLKYHMEIMPWDEVMSKALKLGYLSHKTSTAGLHIHVNRNSLGKTYEDQENTIARMMYFFEDHWDKLLCFSRRTQGQLEQWANRYGYNKDPKGILDMAKKGSRGRYACINILNAQTVEFRIFRGTLKHNTLIAALQLVDEICKAAFSLSDKEIAKLTWKDFVKRLTEKDHKELLIYLKERHLE